MRIALVHDYLREYGAPVQCFLARMVYVHASQERMYGVKR